LLTSIYDNSLSDRHTLTTKSIAISLATNSLEKDKIDLSNTYHDLENEFKAKLEPMIEALSAMKETKRAYVETSDVNQLAITQIKASIKDAVANHVLLFNEVVQSDRHLKEHGEAALNESADVNELHQNLRDLNLHLDKLESTIEFDENVLNETKTKVLNLEAGGIFSVRCFSYSIT